MCSHIQTIKRWWNSSESIRNATQNVVKFQTITDFIQLMKQANGNIGDDNMSKDRFIDTMFEIVFMTNQYYANV